MVCGGREVYGVERVEVCRTERMEREVGVGSRCGVWCSIRVGVLARGCHMAVHTFDSF